MNGPNSTERVTVGFVGIDWEGIKAENLERLRRGSFRILRIMQLPSQPQVLFAGDREPTDHFLARAYVGREYDNEEDAQLARDLMQTFADMRAEYGEGNVEAASLPIREAYRHGSMYPDSIVALMVRAEDPPVEPVGFVTA